MLLGVKNAETKPEFIRLPPKYGRCPYTGLSRTALCELSIPSKKNDFRPPVRSVLIRNRGAIRGTSLLDWDSLMAFLNSCSDESSPTRAEKAS